MDNLNVPYIVYESAMTRSERHIRRLVIALVITIALMFASNALWLYSWMQYDYVSEDTDTEIVTTVDSEGEGIANYTGHDGGVNIGKSDSPQDDADPDADPDTSGK